MSDLNEFQPVTDQAEATAAESQATHAAPKASPTESESVAQFFPLEGAPDGGQEEK